MAAGNGLAAESPRVARLAAYPETLELAAGEFEHGLLVIVRDRAGRAQDVTAHASYVSARPDVVTVSTNGTLRAVADGQTEVRIEFGGKFVQVPVVVRGVAGRRSVSFRQDVEPILTRAGCNMGSCHGKLAGQNGFRLSLRGYAPEQDYSWLVSDLSGRRVNPAFPEESLLLLKALGAVPHEGRQRFAPGSRAHATLAEWIGARAPGPDPAESDPVQLELLPGNRMMRVGETQQLLARARYPDGHWRDVTWLAQFFASDENTASVSPEGLVRAARAGETAVRAHFLGQVAVLTIGIPYENPVSAREFARTSDPIDAAVFAKLKALNLPPSPVCDDATFLRRVTLDLTGTLPGLDRVRAFGADRRKDKRARLVEGLLESPEFVDYWTLQWADLLQNRRERDHDVRGTKGVRAFQAWLRGEIAANRPWNLLARAILTARGPVTEHPEVGYFIYNVGEKRNIEESDTPDAVAQAFLGTRIGCARCHNHPLEKYTQDDFYHFAAFFSKVQMKRTEPDKGPTELKVAARDEEDLRRRLAEAEKGFAEATNAMGAAGGTGDGAALDQARRRVAEQQKRLAEARRQLQEIALRMPTVTQPRTKQAMAPQPLDRRALVFAPGQDPRECLVEWMTDPANRQFGGAMVNRLWKHFLGVGLVEPVDDLRASNPPSNAALWEVLNREFVRSGYDLRQLMRRIVNSRTYQLSSTTRPGNESDRRFYSHYYARRLPAEVLLDAIAGATGVPDEFKGYPVGTRAVQLPEPGVGSYFLSLFGRSERVTACACERNGEVTLPQLLHLQNGDATVKKVRADTGRLKTLLREEPDDGRLIERLFAIALSRAPSREELRKVKSALGRGEREEAFGDLFWALLNSKEFAFNH